MHRLAQVDLSQTDGAGGKVWTVQGSNSAFAVDLHKGGKGVGGGGGGGGGGGPPPGYSAGGGSMNYTRESDVPSPNSGGFGGPPRGLPGPPMGSAPRPPSVGPPGPPPGQKLDPFFGMAVVGGGRGDAGDDGDTTNGEGETYGSEADYAKQQQESKMYAPPPGPPPPGPPSIRPSSPTRASTSPPRGPPPAPPAAFGVRPSTATSASRGPSSSRASNFPGAPRPPPMSMMGSPAPPMAPAAPSAPDAPDAPDAPEAPEAPAAPKGAVRSGGRGALLDSINGFKSGKLKKVKTVVKGELQNN